MITRWLPEVEWPRLVGTELETIWPHLPQGARVWVVEHDGAIVACGSFYDLRHHEGLWMAPGVRRDLDVWRRVGEVLSASTPFLTGALSPGMERLIVRTGGELLPGHHYRCGAIKMPSILEEPVCLPQ